MNSKYKNTLRLTIACLIITLMVVIVRMNHPVVNEEASTTAGQEITSMVDDKGDVNSVVSTDDDIDLPAVHSDSASKVGAENQPAAEYQGAGLTKTAEKPRVTIEDDVPYEPHVVLLSVADGTSIEDVNQLIAQTTSVQPHEVDANELQSGFIQLEVAEGSSVEDALTDLSYADAIEHAQPDYIYYALEEDEGSLQERLGEAAEQQVGETSLDEGAPQAGDAQGSLETESPDQLVDQDAQALAEEETTSADSISDVTDDTSNSATELQNHEEEAPDDNDAEKRRTGIQALAEDLDPITPNDRYLSEQWALTRMRMFEAWAYARCEGTVGVAVLDEGPDASHRDLTTNVIEAYDTYARSEEFSFVLDHGTHVAGIIGATANNGIGVTGVSYNAHLILHNVFYETTGSDGAKKYVTNTSTLIRAYDYLCKNKDSLGVRVINLSLGVKKKTKSSYSDDALVKRINEAYDLGIVTVAAAGNADLGTIPYYEYPGDAPNVVSVMNLYRTKTGADLSFESNHNVDGQTGKNICAPGTSIISTIPTNSYGTMSGTSMAAPHVAGVLALEFSVNPSLTAEEAVTILYATAHDLGEEGWDKKYGWGEVDACAAVKVAKEGTPVELPDISDHEDPEPTVSGPTRVPVGATATFEVRHGSLSIKSGKAKATLDGTTLTGMAEGVVTMSVLDEAGVEQATRNVVVYDTSGCWFLQPYSNDAYALDVKGGSVLNSANVQIYTNNKKNNQVWLLELQKDGSFEVRSAKSGKVLDVSGASTKNAANVIQYARSGKAWQRWRMIVNANNSVTLVNINSSMALELAKTAANSVNVRQGKLTGSAAQQWNLSSTNADIGPIWDGVYKVSTSLNKSYVLDVKGASEQNGGNVQLYKANGNDNQRWRFEYLGQGVYKIVNVNSGKVLDVARGTLKNSTNIDQWSWNNGSNQRWEVEAYSDGSYAILRAGTSWAVDVKGAVAENSRNVHQYQKKGNKAQRWFLTQY